MILIRFQDAAAERKALGYLAGRFSFKTSEDGRTLVPEAALGPWPYKVFISRLKAPRLMSRVFRRYEILLPLRFNDGQPVPDELIADTILELRQQFGAVSSETQTIRGFWHHEGQVYRDELVRLFVDVPEVSESRQFFEAFKERVKARFRQLDIWMTTYLIEVL